MRKSGIAIALGFVFGLACSFLVGARNSSGTYSLPSGNPVVTGTSITSTWANNTLTDIKNELTNSLDRNGRGAMLAPLQLPNGTLAAPSLTFSSDTDTGLYRVGSAQMSLVVDGESMIDIHKGSAITFTQGASLICPSSAEFQNTISVTVDDTNGTAVMGTGAGTGAGVRGTGGGTTGTGVAGVGGATSGSGGNFLGGAPNGVGIVAGGDGTGEGLQVAAGTAATATDRQDAVVITNGDIDMSGVVNPNSDEAISERLTPKNLVKAWGYIGVTGVGSVTIEDGFNITSAACDGSGFLVVTLASAMASDEYMTLVSNHIIGTRVVGAVPLTSTTVRVQFVNIGGSAADCNSLGTGDTVHLLVMGAQ